jgi:hypothetical protein
VQQPEMFEESEEDLYALLHTIQGISTEEQSVITNFIKMGFIQHLLLTTEHQNPDIANLTLKILTELIEDRDLDSKEDPIVKIFLQNDFIATVARICIRQEESRQMVFELLLSISEESRLLSQKCFY